jgi:hypothetical protein
MRQADDIGSIITADARFLATWLSVMPVEKLNRQQLFAEQERLESVIAGYDRLVTAAVNNGEHSEVRSSLLYCHGVSAARLAKVRAAIVEQ